MVVHRSHGKYNPILQITKENHMKIIDKNVKGTT